MQKEVRWTDLSFFDKLNRHVVLKPLKAFMKALSVSIISMLCTWMLKKAFDKIPRWSFPISWRHHGIRRKVPLWITVCLKYSKRTGRWKDFLNGEDYKQGSKSHALALRPLHVFTKDLNMGSNRETAHLQMTTWITLQELKLTKKMLQKNLTVLKTEQESGKWNGILLQAQVLDWCLHIRHFHS